MFSPKHDYLSHCKEIVRHGENSTCFLVLKLNDSATADIEIAVMLNISNFSLIFSPALKSGNYMALAYN